MLIEQAIFTSARTEQALGYQLVARSPGITSQQARELAIWGPSHDALNVQRDEASSVNFHKLSCGTYCVSKTVASGQEYSSRGGARVYTQFLLVPPAVLARFANNPFAVLRAAWAKGILAVHDEPPPVLEPFTLAGRSASVDEGLLAQLAEKWGSAGVAKLVTAAITPGVKLLVGADRIETLIGGLLHCVPVECRGELSFTTGLRFSPRRPFRLVALCGDVAEQRRAARQEDVRVVDLSSSEKDKHEPFGWAAYLADAIDSDQLPRLASELQQKRPGLQMGALDKLGDELLVSLRGEPTISVYTATELPPESTDIATGGISRVFRTDRPRRSKRIADSKDPHQLKTPGRNAPGETPGVTLVAGCGADVHAVADQTAVDLVEELDDAVYEAVSGQPGAIDSVVRLWAQLCERLETTTAAALREQYLRYTLSVWDKDHEEGVREPAKAIGAMDILGVFFKTE